MDIHDIIPDPNALLALEPEEIGGVILEYFNSLPETAKGPLNRHNFSLPHTVQNYPQEYQSDISKALMEGWVWLEREGLIAPDPAQSGEWIFVTRRGKKVKNRAGLESYRRSDMLPRRLLHPQIANKVWASFIRGEYDTAVFQSFKEVEVAVREKSDLPNELLGVALMRKAFAVKDGPLTNLETEKGEREAVQHLFAGAIGSYKNTHSHRHVIIEDPTEAVEMIMLASHLLKIVESRTINTKLSLGA